MKLAVLSAGAPRHGRAITKQWQSIADQNGWGWELEFWEWEEDGYSSRDFSSVSWAVWVGLFERVFEFMTMQPECKHIGLFVGAELLQHRYLVQRRSNDPLGATSIIVADAQNLVEEARQLTILDVS